MPERDDSSIPVIGAVVLAAGMSVRMGRPKMVMPWGGTTVIGRVVSTLLNAGVEQVIVVTGGAREMVEAALSGQPVSFAFNPQFANGEMTASIQAGIGKLDDTIDGFLLALGDQPQMEEDVVRSVMAAYSQAGSRPPLVVPSVQMRRGHPWLVDRSLWKEILALAPPQTMRDFLNSHRHDIVYVEVQTTSILKDLDTPEDYHRQAPV